MGITLEELCNQQFADRHRILTTGGRPFSTILHGGFSSSGEPTVSAPSSAEESLAILPAEHARVLEFMIPKLLRLQANAILIVGTAEVPSSTLALAATNRMSIGLISDGSFAEIIEQSVRYLSLIEATLLDGWPSAEDRAEPQRLVDSAADILHANLEMTFPDGSFYTATRVEQPIAHTSFTDEGFVLTATFEHDLSRELQARCEAVFAVAVLAAIPLGQQRSFESLESQRHKYELLEAFARTDSSAALELLSLQASELGWKVSGWHIVVAGQLNSLERTRKLFATLRSLEVIASDLVTHGDSFLIILTYPSTIKPQLDLSTVVRGELGVSQPMYGPQGLGAAADAAQRHALFAREAGLAVSVQQHSISDPLLSRLFDHPETYELCKRRLAPLLSEGKEELLRTLSVLLDNESNVAASARILHIHRNTVMQRIQSIERALSVSLEKRTDKMMLRCAILGLSFDPNQ